MSAASKSHPLEQQIYEVHVSAVCTTLANFCKIEFSAETPVSFALDTKDFELAGYLGLNGSFSKSMGGEKSAFALLLVFSRSQFLSVYNMATQSELTELAGGEMELAGELLNVAFGIIDGNLRAIGVELVSSFPKVLEGDELSSFCLNLPRQALHVPLRATDGSCSLYIFDTRQA